jgi:Flp pilus assembly protein TadG
MTTTRRRTFAKCDQGAAAVEFALVLPAFAMLTIGLLWACLIVYSLASLHYAVEQAARCYSVNSSQCGSASTAQSYAKSQYAGLGTPTFTASNPACGSQIIGSVTLVLNAAIKRWNVPLTARGCFP